MKLVPPTQAYKLRGGKKTAKYHLMKTQARNNNFNLSVCNYILVPHQDTIADISDLKPHQICLKCLGAMEAVEE